MEYASCRETFLRFGLNYGEAITIFWDKNNIQFSIGQQQKSLKEKEKWKNRL